MKSRTYLFSFVLGLFVMNATAQNIPDVNLHFDSRLINCPTTP